MAATPVFFLPGLLEDADAFAQQVERLRETAACTVADLTRGETIAELAKDALDQAPPGKFALAGHSMGGYVALEVMRQAPERIDRLALLNTNARPDSAESTENRKRLMALAERDFPEVIRTLMPKLVLAKHAADLSGPITEMALACGKDAFMRQERAIIGRIDSRPHLADVRCRTLIIAGRHDAIMPLEILEEMARGIAGSKLAVVEDSGHIPTLEQPREALELLRAWLGES